MKNLKLIKSENFGDIKCDFYGNGSDEFFMTREQIGSALGYSESRIAITKIHDRHRARLDKYSGVTKLVLPKGGTQETTIYNRKGIMEICRWSQQPKADAFIDFVWEVMDGLMSGKSKIMPMSEYQKLMLETRKKNANVREANMLFKIAESVEIPEYKRVLQAHVTKIITGDFLLPLPTAEKHTYSAEDIGKMFGISKQRVGIIANANGLKNSEYGKLFYDKASHCSKQVESFRYYENVIPEFERLLGLTANIH